MEVVRLDCWRCWRIAAVFAIVREVLELWVEEVTEEVFFQ